jgi:tetratricopeptide (TPR) repeat protein
VQVEWNKNPESRTLFYRYFYQPQLFSSRPKVGMPRPLLMETFALNYLAGTIMYDKFHRGSKDRGYDPRGWLLFNVLLHMINTIIIYVALCHLTGKQRIALLTAILFAVHPINTETVNYINCRSESFGVLWMLLCMYYSVRALETDRVLHLTLACVFLALGLLTKELAFVTPFLAFWIGFVFIHRDEKTGASWITDLVVNLFIFFKKQWKKFVALLAVDAAYLIYRAILMSDMVDKPNASIREDLVGVPVRPVLDNLLTQSRVLITYVRLLFFPIHQNISYENTIYTMDQFKNDPKVTLLILACVLALGGIFALGVACYRKHPVVSFAVMNFFITLSITSTVVPLNAIMNEHRLYLPSLGVCLLLVGILERGAEYFSKKPILDGPAWPVPAQAMTVAVILFYVSLTVTRNLTWHTDLTVWRDSIVNSPTKAQVVSDLGNAYYRAARGLDQKGEIAGDGKIDDEDRLVISQTFRVAVPAGPITPEVRKTLNRLYLFGLQRAEQLYLWGIRVEPSYYKAWHNLGTINYTYAQLELVNNQPQSCKKHLVLAVKYFYGASHISANGESFNDMASTEMLLADPDAGIETDPKKREKYLQDAEENYRRAMIFNPGLPKAPINLARILHDKALKSLREGNEQDAKKYLDEAIELLKKAIDINPIDPLPHILKGRWLTELRKYPEAIQSYRECLQRVPGDTNCSEGLQRLEQMLNSPGAPGPP